MKSPGVVASDWPMRATFSASAATVAPIPEASDTASRRAPREARAIEERRGKKPEVETLLEAAGHAERQLRLVSPSTLLLNSGGPARSLVGNSQRYCRSENH